MSILTRIVDEVRSFKTQRWLADAFMRIAPPHVKDGNPLPPGYAIRYVRNREIGPHAITGICHDTREAFLLTLCGRALAAVGFKRIGSSLVVVQLQATAGVAEGLRPLRWERLLLEVAVAWASCTGCADVLVLKGARNPWVAQRPENANRFKIRYDVTASRSGFSELDANYFVKRLASSGGAPPESIPVFSRDWFRPRALDLYT
jgi:hypothetical protein